MWAAAEFEVPSKEKCEVDSSALQYVFPAELRKHFTIIQSGIKTDKPADEDYLEEVFEVKIEYLWGFPRNTMRTKAFSVNEFKISLYLVERCFWSFESGVGDTKCLESRLLETLHFLPRAPRLPLSWRIFQNKEVDNRLDPIATVAYYYKV